MRSWVWNPVRTIRRAAVFALLVLLAAYKAVVRPFLGGACKFHPTCSDYAAEAVIRFGPLRGSVLAARRVCRCVPFRPGGYDPVPKMPGGSCESSAS